MEELRAMVEIARQKESMEDKMFELFGLHVSDVNIKLYLAMKLSRLLLIQHLDQVAGRRSVIVANGKMKSLNLLTQKHLT